MPNHVTTVCDVLGFPVDVERFVKNHIVPAQEDDGTVKDPNKLFFSFDTIIPQPECTKGTTSGGGVDVGMYALYGYIDESKSWLNQLIPSRASLVPYKRWPYLPKTVDTREKLLQHLQETQPESLREAEKSKRCLDETGHVSWYEWCVKEWGTKWGAYDYVEKEREPGRFSFQFDTAWSFPEPIFRELEKMYPELVFDIASYDEGSNFGCRGQFNGRRDYRCEKSLATDELYERVYGSPPEKYDEDEEDDAEDEQYIEEHNETDEDDEPDEADLNDGLDD